MGYEFFQGKIIFPFAPVPGINNDQSLNLCPANPRTVLASRHISGTSDGT